jgi:hypothetical protein
MPDIERALREPPTVLAIVRCATPASRASAMSSAVRAVTLPTVPSSSASSGPATTRGDHPIAAKCVTAARRARQDSNLRPAD